MTADNIKAGYAKLANSQDRIERVERFSIKLKQIPVAGKFHVGFECSEAIVAPAELLTLAVTRSSSAADRMGEGVYKNLDRALTTFFQECLLNKHIYFPDETEDMQERIEVIADDMCVSFNDNFDMVLQKIGISQLN